MDWTLHTRDLYIGKNQKLFQNQNSKWRNFAKAKLAFIQNLVSITDMTYSYHTVFNPYFELDFQNDPGKCDFFHFSFGIGQKLCHFQYINPCSTLISENLKPVEVLKSHINIIETASKVVLIFKTRRVRLKS